MSTSNDLESLYRDVVAALNRGEAETVAGYFTEDGEVVVLSEPDVVHAGRPAITAFVRDYLDSMPGVNTEIVDLVAGEDRLAAELRLTVPIEHQAEHLEIRCCAYYTFRDGMLASEHVYLDPEGLDGLGS